MFSCLKLASCWPPSKLILFSVSVSAIYSPLCLRYTCVLAFDWTILTDCQDIDQSQALLQSILPCSELRRLECSLPPDFWGVLNIISSFRASWWELTDLCDTDEIMPRQTVTVYVYSPLSGEQLVQNPIKGWQNSTKLQLAILHFFTFQFVANWIQ